jgi:hypothetical protein
LQESRILVITLGMLTLRMVIFHSESPVRACDALWDSWLLKCFSSIFQRIVRMIFLKIFWLPSIFLISVFEGLLDSVPFTFYSLISLLLEICITFPSKWLLFHVFSKVCPISFVVHNTYNYVTLLSHFYLSKLDFNVSSPTSVL